MNINEALSKLPHVCQYELQTLAVATSKIY